MDFSSNQGYVQAFGQIKRLIRFTMPSNAIGKRLLIIPKNLYNVTIKKKYKTLKVFSRISRKNFKSMEIFVKLLKQQRLAENYERFKYVP